MATSVFETGPLSVKSIIPVERSSSTSSLPKPLLIITPTIPGTYPVLLFLHGTMLSNDNYTLLLQHIASHGFIIVAPQLYAIIPRCGCEEVDAAAEVTRWLSEGLQPLLPDDIKANLAKFALAGHSRGGKAAFSVALGYAPVRPLKISALIGVDPVAGRGEGDQVLPNILTYVPRSFDLNKTPVMVLGTGLGHQRSFLWGPVCAPVGVSHDQFFSECQPPSYHIVTKDYGHMDMLNDGLGIIVENMCKMCKSGSGDKDLMRRSVGGILVAFLRAALESEDGDLKVILEEPDVSPVKLDPVEVINA